MPWEVSDRLNKLPPYLFAEIDKKKKEAVAKGKDVINLGVGDPDTPTPDFVIEALAEAARDPATHQYALDNGDPDFRRAIAAWFSRRYGVKLDPDREIYPTIGAKEAIAHLPLAFINPGNLALIPEPGYPPYRSGTVFAGGVPVAMDLTEENGFFPDLDAIDPRLADMARLIYVNYPNSPTGVIAGREFFEALIAFAKKYDIIIVQDAAYAELTFEGRAMSIFEVDGAMDCAIEFHSCSKTFNMTGWRVGFAAGNADIVGGLGRVKTNLDSGIFTAIQRAAQRAYERYEEFVPGLVEMYRKRRDAFVNGLNGIGWKVRPPQATFYVWIPIPENFKSVDVTMRLLEECAIVTTPGNGFGRAGEGYIRATLTATEERLKEAVERIASLKW